MKKYNAKGRFRQGFRQKWHESGINWHQIYRITRKNGRGFGSAFADITALHPQAFLWKYLRMHLRIPAHPDGAPIR